MTTGQYGMQAGPADCTGRRRTHDWFCLRRQHFQGSKVLLLTSRAAGVRAVRRADMSMAVCCGPWPSACGAANERCHLPEPTSGGAGPEKAWTFADAPFADDDEDALETD